MIRVAKKICHLAVIYWLAVTRASNIDHILKSFKYTINIGTKSYLTNKQ
jgi:hypothetical protein